MIRSRETVCLVITVILAGVLAGCDESSTEASATDYAAIEVRLKTPGDAARSAVQILEAYLADAPHRRAATRDALLEAMRPLVDVDAMYALWRPEPPRDPNLPARFADNIIVNWAQTIAFYRGGFAFGDAVAPGGANRDVVSVFVPASAHDRSAVLQIDLSRAASEPAEWRVVRMHFVNRLPQLRVMRSDASTQPSHSAAPAASSDADPNRE